MSPLARDIYGGNCTRDLRVGEGTVVIATAKLSIVDGDFRLFRSFADFAFRLCGETLPSKSNPLARRFPRDDESNVLHLLTRRHHAVADVRAVRHFKRDRAKLAEAAGDRLLAFAKPLLSVCPVARAAKRLPFTPCCLFSLRSCA